MRGDAEVGAMVGFFFIGVALGNTVALEKPPEWISDLFVGAVTLVAAYLGARYAFIFNENQQRERRISDEVSSGNQAIFNLIKAYNKFGATYKQFIAPHLQSKYRSLEILPIVGHLGGFEPQSTKDVAFLLNSDDPNVLNDIAQLEAEIIMTLELIAERSKTHLREVQRKFDAARITQDVQLNDAQLKAILGERVMVTMAMATDQMISSVESVISGCKVLIPRLNALLKKHYPGHNIISMQVVEEVPVQQQVQGPTSPPSAGPRP